jgi:hypothetical protein
MKKKKRQKGQCVIGRFFKTQESLFEYLLKKEEEYKKQGFVHVGGFMERFRVLVGKNGLLLINNPEIYG